MMNKISNLANINMDKLRSRAKDIDAHLELWKLPDEYLIEFFSRKAEECKKRIERYERDEAVARGSELEKSLYYSDKEQHGIMMQSVEG